MATRLAILLAGTGTDHLHSSSFARFSGRWLLSLINDLTKASSERKAAALLRYKKFDYNTNYRFPGFQSNNLDEFQSGESEEADQTFITREQNQVERNNWSENQSLSAEREEEQGFHSLTNLPQSGVDSHTDSTGKLKIYNV